MLSAILVSALPLPPCKLDAERFVLCSACATCLGAEDIFKQENPLHHFHFGCRRVPLPHVVPDSRRLLNSGVNEGETHQRE